MAVAVADRAAEVAMTGEATIEVPAAVVLVAPCGMAAEEQVTRSSMYSGKRRHSCVDLVTALTSPQTEPATT